MIGKLGMKEGELYELEKKRQPYVIRISRFSQKLVTWNASSQRKFSIRWMDTEQNIIQPGQTDTGGGEQQLLRLNCSPAMHNCSEKKLTNQIH